VHARRYSTAPETRFSERRNGQGDNVRDEVESGIYPKNVETRASGRPPEEAASDNPQEQARAILEDSEVRKKAGADPSEDDGDA
jgi:hypothetical protein